MNTSALAAILSALDEAERRRRDEERIQREFMDVVVAESDRSMSTPGLKRMLRALEPLRLRADAVGSSEESLREAKKLVRAAMVAGHDVRGEVSP